MITLEQYLMGRDAQYPNEYNDTIKSNAETLLNQVNSFLTQIGWQNPQVNSGWRPPEVNDATANAAAHSKHMVGLAVDIADPDGSLWALVLKNLSLANNLELAFEDKRWTPSWTHIQLGKPASGHLIFIPSSAPAPAPHAWDGNYDHSLDG